MLEIRAHHLLCIPRFKSGGYTREFSRHMRELCKQIRAKPGQEIQVVKKTDAVCIGCPHFKENICIKKKEINKWILKHDEAVLEKLELTAGEIYKAKELFNLSIEKISAREIKEICAGCEFQKYCIEFGFNKAFIKDLNKKSRSD